MGAVKAPTIRRHQSCKTVTTIGLAIAKAVFQVHTIAEGKVLIRGNLKTAQQDGSVLG